MTTAIETPVIGAASGREITRFKNYFEGTGGDTGYIAVEDIYVQPGFNARNFALPENRAHLDALKADIVAYGGIHTPIKVAFDPGSKAVELVDGESRYRAVKELNAEGHSFLILATAAPRSKVTDPIERVILSLSANTGKPFAQWEVGSAYEKLQLAGWSIATIAQRFNKSERYVRDAIDLAPAPEDIKVALSKGEITVAVALKAIRRNGSQASTVISQAVATAKANGTGKVVAGYVKRAEVTKVPNDLLRKLHATLSQYSDKPLAKLAEELAEFLPGDKAQGKAAKELDTF